MKSYEQLAKSGYKAACKKTRELAKAQGSDTPDPNVPWDEIDEDTRESLIAFTKQVVAEAALVH
jgi:hypothetical protein